MLSTHQLSCQQTKDMQDLRHELYQSLYLNQHQLKEHRLKQLKTLLDYAKNFSPWYKKTLAHININTMTEENLLEIPPINKTILMDNWDEIVTDRTLSLSIVEKHIEKLSQSEEALYLNNRYHLLATSGSSGKRGVFIYNWEEWNKYYLYFRRHRLYDEERRTLLLSPTKKIKIAMVIATNAVYAMYALNKTYQVDNVKTAHFPMTLPLDQIITGLNETQADILQGIPSTIYKLCKEANRGRLKIQPKIISIGAEPLYQEIRETIQETWPNAAIFNTFGSSEGLIGTPCRANSKEMHLNEDAYILQPVNKQGNLINKDSKPTKMYITNLFNYTLPLIRYEFTDQFIFLNKTCDCGCIHQLIAEPQGRPEFDFIYDNIFVHHLIFVTPLLQERNIQEYQVIQTNTGFDIKIVSTGSVDHAKLKNIIKIKLNELGIAETTINVIEIEKFDYPDSGKLKRFIPLGSFS
ncbi:MAG: phenylacetate--CoA ligase family protein [Legionella sp.]|nr:phenylacetate--CoA ligase family protein [Legionella sp.]